MGLDAHINCDCYERGLTTPPPPGYTLHQDASGSIETDEGLPTERYLAFDRWRDGAMCEHRDGVLIHFRLGNIGMIGTINAFLAEQPEHYPVLLKKVVYSGSHCGDQLSLDDAVALGPELRHLEDRLSNTRVTDESQRDLLIIFRGFHDKLRALRELSIRVKRPIVF